MDHVPSAPSRHLKCPTLSRKAVYAGAETPPCGKPADDTFVPSPESMAHNAQEADEHVATGSYHRVYHHSLRRTVTAVSIYDGEDGDDCDKSKEGCDESSGSCGNDRMNGPYQDHQPSEEEDERGLKEDGDCEGYRPEFPLDESVHTVLSNPGGLARASVQP